MFVPFSLFAVSEDFWLFLHFKRRQFLPAPAPTAALNLVSRQVVEREEVQHLRQFIIKDLFGSFRPEKRKFSRCVQGRVSALEFFTRDIEQRAVFQPRVFSFVLLAICLISFPAP